MINDCTADGAPSSEKELLLNESSYCSQLQMISSTSFKPANFPAISSNHFSRRKKEKLKECFVRGARQYFLGMMERWIKHYSSGHNILLVGEGDFSFSRSLAMAFGSATNIVATSLDSYEGLICKYKNAIANVATLTNRGATVLYGVDATQMRTLPELRWERFDRIIYNFPHAGFYGKEDIPCMITMHRDLVRGFLQNASSMLRFDGEIHINHKTTAPFDSWRIEDLGLDCSLLCIEQDEFKSEDYPGYQNKRGAGSRSDEPFPLRACKTFKFKLCPEENLNKMRKLDLMLSPPPLNPLAFHDLSIKKRALHNYTSEFKHCPEENLNKKRKLDLMSPFAFHDSSIEKRAMHNHMSEDCLRNYGGIVDGVEDGFGRSSHEAYRLVEESRKARLLYMHGSSSRAFACYIQD